MFSSGYDYARWEHCAACGEPVEVYTTPGKREIAMEPMCSSESPAVRHYEVCKPKEDQSVYLRNEASGRTSEPTGPDSDSGTDGTGGGPDNDAQLRHGETRISVGRLDAESAGIKLYGVTDPNKQLIAVGWSDGVLLCQFKTAKWSYAGVPEAEVIKLKNSPFAYRIFARNIKHKYPGTKLE
jgi:hypothetical protein